MLRYQAIKSKWTCCLKTEIHNYSFDARKKIWNENVQRKFCQESSNLPFAVPGNVKLKLPNGAALPKAIKCYMTVLIWLSELQCNNGEDGWTRSFPSSKAWEGVWSCEKFLCRITDNQSDVVSMQTCTGIDPYTGNYLKWHWKLAIQWMIPAGDGILI
jgi:hypothetical protein